MKPKRRQPVNFLEEAQRWERVVESGGPEERDAFGAWVKRSPRHLQAYMQHVAVETELRDLDAEHQLNLDALLAQVSSPVQPPARGRGVHRVRGSSDSGAEQYGGKRSMPIELSRK